LSPVALELPVGTHKHIKQEYELLDMLVRCKGNERESCRPCKEAENHKSPYKAPANAVGRFFFFAEKDNNAAEAFFIFFFNFNFSVLCICKSESLGWPLGPSFTS